MAIQDDLIWIDLNDDESAPIIHQIKVSTRKPTGKHKIVISVFDLYIKEIGDSNGNERVTTFAYKNRALPNNANMLKTSYAHF